MYTTCSPGRCSAPAKASYLTQTKEGRRSVNPDVRVYEPSQSDEQGFRLVQQCIRQLHTSEPKLEPKVPVVRDVRRLLDKNSVMVRKTLIISLVSTLLLLGGKYHLSMGPALWTECHVFFTKKFTVKSI